MPHERTKQSPGRYRLDPVWAAKIRERLLSACHPKQRAFVEDTGRRVSARVGRGGGKTTGWLARALIKATSIRQARIVFIATTRLSAETLIWEKLKTVCDKARIPAQFNESKLTCRILMTGGTIRLVGADNKHEIDKLRGQSFHEVGIDEMASYPPELLEALIDRVIAPRLGDLDGVIAMVGTPGHILRGPAYEATRPGGERHRPYEQRNLPEFANWLGWSSHHWTLEDGAKAGIVALQKLWTEALREKAEKNWADNNPIWLREYMGEWAADSTDTIIAYRIYDENGALFNQWDPERVGPMRIGKLPGKQSDYLFFFAMDMGHKDPFALSVFALNPADKQRMIYHVYEFERPRMYSRTIAQLMLGADDAQPLGCKPASNPSGVIGATGWPTKMVADVTAIGGAVLEELKVVYGIAAEPAKQKDKFAGIETGNGWLLEGRVKILKGSKLEQQMMTLQWEINEFGEKKENKSQANHLTDTWIYVCREIAAMFDVQAADARPAPLLTNRVGVMTDSDIRIATGADLSGADLDRDILDILQDSGEVLEDWP